MARAGGGGVVAAVVWGFRVAVVASGRAREEGCGWWGARSVRLFGVVDADTFVGGFAAMRGVVVEFALVGGWEICLTNSAFGACAVGGTVVSVAVCAGEFVGRGGGPGSGGAGTAHVMRR